MEYIAYTLVGLMVIIGILAFVGSLPVTIKQMEVLQNNPHDQQIGFFWKLTNKCRDLIMSIFDFFLLIYLLIRNGEALRKEAEEEEFGEETPHH